MKTFRECLLEACGPQYDAEITRLFVEIQKGYSVRDNGRYFPNKIGDLTAVPFVIVATRLYDSQKK